MDAPVNQISVRTPTTSTVDFRYLCSHSGKCESFKEASKLELEVCDGCKKLECANCFEVFHFKQLERGLCFNCLFCNNCYDVVKLAINRDDPICSFCEHRCVFEAPIMFEYKSVSQCYSEGINQIYMNGNDLSAAINELENNKTSFDKDFALEEARILTYLDKLQAEKRKVETEYKSTRKQLKFMEYENADMVDWIEKANILAQTAYAPEHHKEVAKNKLLDVFKTFKPSEKVRIPQFVLRPTSAPEVNIFKDNSQEAHHLPFNDGYVYILENPSQIYDYKAIPRLSGVFAGCGMIVIPNDESWYITIYHMDNKLVAIVPSKASPHQYSDHWDVLNKDNYKIVKVFLTNHNTMRMTLTNGFNNSDRFFSLVEKTDRPFVIDASIQSICYGGMAIEANETQNIYQYNFGVHRKPCKLTDYLKTLHDFHGSYEKQTIKCSPYFNRILFDITLDSKHYFQIFEKQGTDLFVPILTDTFTVLAGDATESYFVLCHNKIVEISTIPGKFITVHEYSPTTFKVLYQVPTAPVPIKQGNDFIREVYFGYGGRLTIIMNNFTLVY